MLCRLVAKCAEDFVSVALDIRKEWMNSTKLYRLHPIADMMLESMMTLDFSCSHLLYETIEEIRGFGLCIENLLENSVDDVVWCMRKAFDSL